MSSEQIRPQVPFNLFGANSWIVQMIGQWIPDCWSGDRKSTGPKSVAANSRNWQLMDDIWQIADAGDQQLWILAHSIRQGAMVPACSRCQLQVALPTYQWRIQCSIHRW